MKAFYRFTLKHKNLYKLIRDAEGVAYCLMGISVFTAMRWPVWEGKMPPAEFTGAVFDFITKGLAPREEKRNEGK
ncbi:MAG: hypothetical protein ACOY30_03020 [Bacillota bacterium]